MKHRSITRGMDYDEKRKLLTEPTFIFIFLGISKKEINIYDFSLFFFFLENGKKANCKVS